jgi:hypothetical protein
MFVVQKVFVAPAAMSVVQVIFIAPAMSVTQIVIR